MLRLSLLLFVLCLPLFLLLLVCLIRDGNWRWLLTSPAALPVLILTQPYCESLKPLLILQPNTSHFQRHVSVIPVDLLLFSELTEFSALHISSCRQWVINYNYSINVLLEQNNGAPVTEEVDVENGHWDVSQRGPRWRNRRFLLFCCLWKISTLLNHNHFFELQSIYLQ